MSLLRQQMQNDMVIRGMAARTQESYLSAVKGIARYYRLSPDAISVQEVQSYLLHLLQERGLSASTCNLVLNGVVLLPHHARADRDRVLPPPSQATPEVAPDLQPGGDRPLFEVTTNLKHRTLLMATYGAGLRVSEVARLK